MNFWFRRPSKKATATSKFHDDQQIGGPSKGTPPQKKGSFFQKAMTPPIADILEVPT